MEGVAGARYHFGNLDLNTEALFPELFQGAEPMVPVMDVVVAATRIGYNQGRNAAALPDLGFPEFDTIGVPETLGWHKAFERYFFELNLSTIGP